MTTTIHFAISIGTPSACYPADEQRRNGALDHEVTMTIATPEGERVVEGEITLYRDHDGTMGPCGSPRDGWVSGSLLAAIDQLGDGAARAVLAELACGHRSDGDVITLANA